LSGDAGGMAVVQRWIDVYRAAGISRGPLFCTLGGDFISANAVRQMMQRAAERAGLERRVHPHGLRHTMSAEWVREGRPMALLRGQLGHSPLAVTDRYLRDIAHVGRAAVITSNDRHRPIYAGRLRRRLAGISYCTTPFWVRRQVPGLRLLAIVHISRRQSATSWANSTARASPGSRKTWTRARR
jgi:hypothetical protein